MCIRGTSLSREQELKLKFLEISRVCMLLEHARFLYSFFFTSHQIKIECCWDWEILFLVLKKIGMGRA